MSNIPTNVNPWSIPVPVYCKWSIHSYNWAPHLQLYTVCTDTGSAFNLILQTYSDNKGVIFNSMISAIMIYSSVCLSPGESGLGKSTLINSLFLTDLYSKDYPGPSQRIKKTVQVS